VFGDEEEGSEGEWDRDRNKEWDIAGQGPEINRGDRGGCAGIFGDPQG
jgi:hypothetical protein